MNNTYSTSSGNDVFNNPSNDYVNPGLAPCAGLADSNTFEFLNKKNVGIISGSAIVSSMSLSDISIPVTEWITKTQVIQSGEIIYVPGLTKGLLNKSTFFPIPDFGYDSQEYFFSIDLSVNYYSNFRMYEKSICASANFDANLDIDDALNIELGDKATGVSVIYDASSMNFVGNNPGFDYDVYNVVLNIIDASMDANSPFPPIIIDGERLPQTYELTIDKDQTIPAMKYPNGAMLGYMMTAVYPAAQSCEADRWLYTNNVNSPFDVYYQQYQPTGMTDISINKVITFDPPTYFGEVSINFTPIADVEISDMGIFPTPDVDSSTIIPPQSHLLSALSINNCFVYEPIMVNSVLSNSSIFNNTDYTEDPSLLNDIVSIIDMCSIKDSSIVTSQPTDVSITVRTQISLSKFQNVNIDGTPVPILLDPSALFDPSTMQLIEDSFTNVITESELKYSNINSAFLAGDVSILGDLDPSTGKIDRVENNELNNSVAFYTNITGMQIIDTYLGMANVTRSALAESYFHVVNGDNLELYSCTIEHSDLMNSETFDSIINSTNITNSIINESNVATSNVVNSAFKSAYVIDSDIQNAFISYEMLAPGLWVPDTSSVGSHIVNANIYDTSINNAILVDCSIYTSNLIDASLFGCTLYNSIFEDENVYLDPASTSVWIDGDYDCSISWTYDTSLLYEKYTKQIDVGMNGSGDDKVLSAGEYLDYINTHGLWEKFGPLNSKFSTEDPINSNIKNLIGGFYVFNPHTFPVQLEYMLIN